MAMPQEPMTALGASAAAHHELVMTYVAAGFSRQEAMQVLLLLISVGIQRNNQEG
jgi:hypothetical protein